jgi:uncharacterized protein
MIMKKITALLCFSFILGNCVAQKDTANAKQITQNNPAMKQYWFVMLVKGKDRDKITDTTVLNKLQEGHMANIRAMAAQGKLMVAGPFGDDGYWRGIFIFDAASKEEVIALLQNDPAIKAGRLDYEIHPWWTQRGAVIK